MKKTAIEDIAQNKAKTAAQKRNKKSKEAENKNAVPNTVQTSYKNNEYGEITAIDTGVRNIVSVSKRRYVRKAGEPTKVYKHTFNVKSKDFHYWCGYKKNGKDLKKIIGSFDVDCMDDWKKSQYLPSFIAKQRLSNAARNYKNY